jgi:putative endonuclease
MRRNLQNKFVAQWRINLFFLFRHRQHKHPVICEQHFLPRISKCSARHEAPASKDSSIKQSLQVACSARCAFTARSLKLNEGNFEQGRKQNYILRVKPANGSTRHLLKRRRKESFHESSFSVMHWSSFISREWKRRVATKASDESANAHNSALAPHLVLGRRGEELAAAYLEQCGYRLVAANFLLPVGRSLRNQVIHAEIDIIAHEAATLCFIEVKTRASDWFAAPETNVDLRKQRQISRAARVYRRTFNLINEPYRYDVVSIILPHAHAELTERKQTPARLQLLRNFWTDAKFRKRRWTGAHFDD